MGAGLQVWDAAGNLIFDTNDRMSRVLGSAIIGAAATGYITNADFATGTIWWSIVANSSVLGYYCPNVTIDAANNRIGYSPATGTTPGPVDVKIYYGVY